MIAANGRFLPHVGRLGDALSLVKLGFVEMEKECSAGSAGERMLGASRRHQAAPPAPRLGFLFPFSGKPVGGRVTRVTARIPSCGGAAWFRM
jgi:hypothetical protein